MPHAPIMQVITSIALTLLALVLLWVLASGVGMTPRAIRLRRAIQRDGGPSLRCGACGHAAVALERVAACPECGAQYATVGLDTPATATRWGMPPAVLALLLLGAGALASVHLSPRAAMLANRWTIGSAEVERWQSRLALVDMYTFGPGGARVSIAELDRSFIGPADPPAGGGPRRPIAGTLTLRLSAQVNGSSPEMAWMRDPLVTSAIDRWRRANPSGYSRGVGQPPPATIPAAGALPSPWDGVRATGTTVTLAWPAGSERWTLTGGGAPPATGASLNEGVRAALERLGPAADAGGIAPTARMQFEGLRDAVDPRHTRTMRNVGADPRALRHFGPFRIAGELTATPTRMLLHPAAPWGIAAFAAVPLAWLALCVLALWLAARAHRRAKGP